MKKKTQKSKEYVKNYVYGGNNRKGVKDLNLEQWFEGKAPRNRGKRMKIRIISKNNVSFA